MKYMDYAAMGAAFSASQRASEAFEEIERLQNQIDAMNLSAWNDREEREFQKWIEEFIYQFGKTIDRIETTPRDPVEDFQEIAAYFKMIAEKNINTSAISGLENKKVFEDVLSRAEKLYGALWNHPRAVKRRNLLAKQEEEKKEIQEAKERQRHLKAKKKVEVLGWVIGITGVVALVAMAVGADSISKVAGLFMILSLLACAYLEFW